MGWRDVQAGVASGAINYAKKPDKFGSFLEGFATTYAAGAQKKADRDYAEKLAADRLKAAELKEEKTLRQERERKAQEHKDIATAALDMQNIPYSKEAYQKAFSLASGGASVIQVADYFKQGIEDRTIVQTPAYETYGPMPRAATTDMSVFSPLTGRESGIGGYDALLNQSQNDQFANIKVSQMSLGDVLNFQTERKGNSYHAWSKANMPEGTEAKLKGLGSTPAGKYQFIGDTMKYMKDKAWTELGFDNNTPFNQDTQDALFLWLAQDKMRGASTQEQKRAALRGTWEGIKDPAKVSNEQVDKIITAVETGVFNSADVVEDGDVGPDYSAKLKPGQILTFVLNQGYDIQEGGTGGPNDLRKQPYAAKSRQLQKVTATVQADGTLQFPGGWQKVDVSNMTAAQLQKYYATEKLEFYKGSKFRKADDFNQPFMTGQIYLSDPAGELLKSSSGTEQDRNIPAGMQFNVKQPSFDDIDISDINTLREYTAMDRNIRAGNKRISPEFETVWNNLKETLTAADTATSIEEILPLKKLLEPEMTASDLDNRIRIAQAKFGSTVELPSYVQTAKDILADRPAYTEDELRELDYNQRLLIEKTHPNGNIKALAATINRADPQRFPSGIELGQMSNADLEGVIAGVEATILPLEEDGRELDPVSRDFVKTARFIIASRQSGSIANLVKPENLMKLSSGDAIEKLIAAATGAGMDETSLTQANAILESVRAAEDGQVDYSTMTDDELLGKIAIENASENPDQAKLTAMNVIFNSREGKFDIKDYDDIETPTIQVEINELSKKILQQQEAVSRGTEGAAMSAQDSARLLALQSLVSKRQAEKDQQVVFAKDSPTYIISYKDPATNELVVSTAQVLANGNLYDTGSRKVVPEGVEITTSDLELNSAKGQLLAQMQTRDLQPVKESRQSSASMLRSAFILNSYVDPAQNGNPDILTTVGNMGSRIIKRLDNEIAAFNSMLQGGASDAEILASIDQMYQERASSLKGQARNAVLFEAELYKFAYTFAASTLEQRGAGLSNRDFATALNIVRGGTDFVTFSKNLKSQVSQGLSATQVKINDLKNNSPQIKLLNELDPTKDLTSGYTMNLSDWFKTQNLNTEYNWVNSETAAPASTAKPDAVQKKSVSELVNPYRDSATFAADRKAFEELAASPENQAAFLKIFSKQLGIPADVLKKLYTPK